MKRLAAGLRDRGALRSLAGLRPAGADAARAAGLTLAPPTPAGMAELKPEVAPPPDAADDNCDRTASLRPFPDQERRPTPRWPTSATAAG